LKRTTNLNTSYLIKIKRDNSNKKAEIQLLDKRGVKHMVDTDFISEQEGGQYTEGYVPEDSDGNPIGNSGVTIGTGVDLGQRSREELENMGLPDELIDRVEPYLGMQGEDAQDYVEDHPLNITEEEANTLDEAVHSDIQGRLEENFNRDSDVNFNDLPEAAQTVIADVATQYGPDLAERTPNFWDAVTHQDWDRTYDELRDFHDDYPTRRNDEADLLQPLTSGGGAGGGGAGGSGSGGASGGAGGSGSGSSG